MAQQTNYRCSCTHDNHKRGDVITAEQYKTIAHQDKWVPVLSNEELRQIKLQREKIVNHQNVVLK